MAAGRMTPNALTISIPTRDRPALLEKCLNSIYANQSTIPEVVVSDNSVKDHPIIETFRRRYGFKYVRQSGHLSQPAHMNVCCLELPDTQWVLLLHDDDELYPGCLAGLHEFLSRCDSIGIVVAGIQFIDFGSRVQKQWTPAAESTLRGEEALLRLGLDWRARPPGMILNVAACRRIGGFIDVCGSAADYTLAIQLAYGEGLAFFPALVGRYRQGPQQLTDFSTPEKGSAWLEYSIQQAERTQTIGCSTESAKRVLDYLTWWPFLGVAPQLLPAHPFHVFELTHKCLRRSPYLGEWQIRVRRQYPLMFWRPIWLACMLYLLTRKLRSIAKTLIR
jgi:hypothetical protein